MKKILVVFTGGTIGSTIQNDTIAPTLETQSKLLQLYFATRTTNENIEFVSIKPYEILSENLAPMAWQILIEAIEAAQPNQYAGIIVTHGTDTLAYTAAALSFYFHAIKIPMLLVSSNTPLGTADSNGIANFNCAVEFILQNIAPGVFVPYRNAVNENMQIHLGSRLTCSLQLTGDFFSVQNKSYMTFDGGNNFTLIDKNIGINPRNPALSAFNPKLKPQFSKQILMLKPYPGLDYSHVNLAHTDAVVHDLYHSGTACATTQWGNNYSLVEFLKHCQEHNVPVYLAPAIKSPNAYQSTHELLAHGAQMLWNMSIEAAYIKLMLAYGNFTDAEQRHNYLESTQNQEHIL